MAARQVPGFRGHASGGEASGASRDCGFGRDGAQDPGRGGTGEVEAGRAKSKRPKAKRRHPPRERRPRLGEWVQIDGRPHDGFEGRGPRRTPIVFVDGATSRLAASRFAPAETTAAYLEARRAHGRPLALESDRYGIFRVNAKEGAEGDGFTEFGRVAERLRIELVQAGAPQAKGRVERANPTLQDRQIKEMRLAGVSSVAWAQAFAQGFIAAGNARFAKPARNPADAHRPWSAGDAALAMLRWTRPSPSASNGPCRRTSPSASAASSLASTPRGLALRHAKVTQ